MGAPDAATQLMDVATTAAPTAAPLAKDHPKQPKEAVAPALPAPTAPDAAEADEDEAPRRVLLVAKWNKQEIDLCVDASLTVGDLKIILESETTVPPERQRVAGLKAQKGRVSDASVLGDLVLKLPQHKFMLVGTPEAQLLVEPAERPEVFDDSADPSETRTSRSAWEWQRRSRGELDDLGAATGRPWRLVFADAFDRDGPPDPARWAHQTDCNAWVNNAVHAERQHYTDASRDNARVAGGLLLIRAAKEASGGQAYSSARLTTRSAANGRWRYGRVEVCARLTPGKRGLWPAIWLMPSASKFGKWPKSGEIDVMENVGYEPGVIRASVHTEHNHRRRGNHNRRVAGVRDCHDDFHVYAVEWTAERLDFFVDDRKFYTYANEHKGHEQWPFDEPFHLILNVAVGGSWGGRRGIADDACPAEMAVAYVKVFQRAEDAGD